MPYHVSNSLHYLSFASLSYLVIKAAYIIIASSGTHLTAKAQNMTAKVSTALSYDEHSTALFIIL